MMELILDRWITGDYSDPDPECWLRGADIDNCATERILRNEFRHPLWPSDSDDDDHPPNVIDWNEIFKINQPQKSKHFVPCLRSPPPYPKVSELSKRQHCQILKIMSDEHPNILEEVFLGKPSKQDFKAYESIKEAYLNEQKAYKEWAKTLWTTDHCIRALRPKPDVERVYEAEFKMKAQRMRDLPKHYDVAAHITLENGSSNCHAVLKQELISVTLAEMPQVHFPEKMEQQFNIIKPYMVPEPCQKHPYQIVLPNEEALSMLPMTEVHREMAIFAVNNETQYIASENALKCLTQWNRHWLLPLSVCDTIGPDGNRVNVLVLDSEFSVHKEAAPMRTYKAFRHLLEQALIPSSERERVWGIRKSRAIKKDILLPTPPKLNVNAKPTVQDVDRSSDDEDHHLFIDTEEVTEPEFFGFEPPKANFGTLKAGLRSPKPEFESPKADIGTLKRGLSSPKAGFEAPKAGSRSSKAEFDSPKVDFGTPKAGIRSPTAGFVSPKPSLRSSKAGFDSPKVDIGTLKRGLRSPKADFSTPIPGLPSLKAGLVSPNAGFVSPNTSSGSPNVFRFGIQQAEQSVREETEGNAGVISPNTSSGSPNVFNFVSQQAKRSVRGETKGNAGFVSPNTSSGSPNVFNFVSPQAKQSMRGDTKGNAGFVSPSTSFGSPNVSSFGSPQAKQSVRGDTEGSLRRFSRLSCQESTGRLTRAASRTISAECPEVPDIGLYSCTCEDTLYEKPPRRSFSKWQFKKEATIEKLDIIIHSPHKAKDKTGELILEPLPEYQLDLGASEQSPDAVRGAALLLTLRKNASLLNVRVDGPTGDVATFEKLSSEAFAKRHPDVTQQVINIVHTALNQLQDLKPGHYVLQHEPSHGPNAMLLCPRSATERHSLQLNFESGQLIEVDEAQLAKQPPTISTALLPYHKHHRVAPCAFTPFENMVVKETKKQQPKKKVPPQAIKFPKRRGKKK